jgi:hypothetical protein
MESAMKLIPVTVILVLILIGCENNEVIDRFQIISSSEGSMYRLNKSTGEIWYIHEATMKKVEGEKFRLKVNERYICEDGYNFVYKGKGQIGDIKSLNDYWEKK